MRFSPILCFLVASLVLFQGCQSSPEFVLKEKVRVDESTHVITGKPGFIRMVDEDQVALVSNRKEFLIYDIRTGKPVHRMDLSHAFEDSLYQVLAKNQMEDRKGFDAYPPDLDSMIAFNEKYQQGTPYHQLHPFFWYDQQEQKAFVFYQISTPLIDSSFNGIGGYKSKAILELDAQLNVRKAYSFSPLPDSIRESKSRPSLWPFFGFSMKDGELITYLNGQATSAPLGKNRFLATFEINETNKTITYKEPVDISFPLKAKNDQRVRMQMFQSSFFGMMNGRLHFSNGAKIFDLTSSQPEFPGLNKNFPQEMIYNFSLSDRNPDLLYYTILASKKSDDKKEFHLKAVNTAKEKLLDSFKIEPYYSKPTFFKDELLILSREKDYYYFLTYALE